MRPQIHAKGSYSESVSKSSLKEILSLIPDNSNSQVSPRDLRDALFSIWEGSPIKFTYFKSFPYIGLDRPDTKLKLFLGKRELRGDAIMSIDLLNSDVDIFLYNNKLDDSEYHDFKMSILAGIDKSLWKFAPTIEVRSRDKNLDILINNTNGEVSFNSSQSISINDIKWPSKEDIGKMILDPDKIKTEDLDMVLVDGKYIQFKRSNSLSEMTFTDDNPTQVDIGGIKAGSTFKDVPISELIRQILYPYLPPKVKIEFVGLGPNNSIERDHSNDLIVNFTVSILRRSEDLDSSIVKLSNSKTILLVRENEVSHSDGPAKFEYVDSIHIESNKISSDRLGEITLSMEVKDKSGSLGFTFEKLNFVYPYFYGFYGEGFDSNDISKVLGSLNKRIDIKSDQSIPVIGEGYFYFAYPKVYGEILSINGVSIDKLFNFNQVKNVYSMQGKWGSVEYYIYTSKEEVSIAGIPSIWNFEF